MLEVLDRIVGQVALHRRIDDHGAGRAQHQRVAVGRRLGRRFHRDRAGRAGLVVDDHVLAERGAELLGQRPRHQIGAAARGERHDHADRFGRPFGVLRLRKRRRHQSQGHTKAERPA